MLDHDRTILIPSWALLSNLEDSLFLRVFNPTCGPPIWLVSLPYCLPHAGEAQTSVEIDTSPHVRVAALMVEILSEPHEARVLKGRTSPAKPPTATRQAENRCLHTRLVVSCSIGHPFHAQGNRKKSLPGHTTTTRVKQASPHLAGSKSRQQPFGRQEKLVLDCVCAYLGVGSCVA